ncbi:hypothetical protein PN473_02775, partial [Dolichospermum circinale CS-545/17]|nr:hypothetical protein [Dolichospermum circinale CS-545/17]
LKTTLIISRKKTVQTLYAGNLAPQMRELEMIAVCLTRFEYDKSIPKYIQAFAECKKQLVEGGKPNYPPSDSRVKAVPQGYHC